MRIDGNGRIAGPAAGSQARRASAGGFSLQSGATASEAPSTRAAPAMTGLDSMLALQSVEDPLARRRKALRRGATMLDLLESAKLDLLAGADGAAPMERLRAVAAEARDASGEPGLDGVLDEIELRVAVEIAKRSRNRV